MSHLNVIGEEVRFILKLLR